MDIYEEFMNLYNNTDFSIPAITTKLINENWELINEGWGDWVNFWFAIAQAQRDCGELGSSIVQKISAIIDTDYDINCRRESGAWAADVRKRKLVLAKFYAKLQTPRRVPKKRVKKKLYNSLFARWECVAFRREDNHYGWFFVLHDEQETESWLNLIIMTTIDLPTKPVLTDFKNTMVYFERNNYPIAMSDGRRYDRWKEEPLLFQVPRGELLLMQDLHVVGHMKWSIIINERHRYSLVSRDYIMTYKLQHIEPERKLLLRDFIGSRSLLELIRKKLQ